MIRSITAVLMMTFFLSCAPKPSNNEVTKSEEIIGRDRYHGNIEQVPLLRSSPSGTVRLQEGLGGMSAMYYRIASGYNNAIVLEGLPGDACISPHWGYVLKGKMKFHFSDSSLTIDSGELYYAAPGHTLEVIDTVELVEFGPDKEMKIVMDHIASKRKQSK